MPREAQGRPRHVSTETTSEHQARMSERRRTYPSMLALWRWYFRQMRWADTLGFPAPRMPQSLTVAAFIFAGVLLGGFGAWLGLLIGSAQ